MLPNRKSKWLKVEKKNLKLYFCSLKFLSTAGLSDFGNNTFTYHSGNKCGRLLFNFTVIFSVSEIKTHQVVIFRETMDSFMLISLDLCLKAEVRLFQGAHSMTFHFLFSCFYLQLFTEIPLEIQINWWALPFTSYNYHWTLFENLFIRVKLPLCVSTSLRLSTTSEKPNINEKWCTAL